MSDTCCECRRSCPSGRPPLSAAPAQIATREYSNRRVLATRAGIPSWLPKWWSPITIAASFARGGVAPLDNAAARRPAGRRDAAPPECYCRQRALNGGHGIPRRGLARPESEVSADMLSQAPERRMRFVRTGLLVAWLVLIASLLWDPVTPGLTAPDNLV